MLYLPTALLGAPIALRLAFALISGLSLPAMLPQVFALVAQRVDADVATEANAWVVSAFKVGIGAGTFLAAAAVEASGTIGTAAAVVGASAVAAVAALGALTIARGPRCDACLVAPRPPPRLRWNRPDGIHVPWSAPRAAI